jgi:hypothetical protein
VLLIHLADGAGLRETAVRAKLAGLANISYVGILKRLKRCGAWFKWMAQACPRAASWLIAAASIPIASATAAALSRWHDG